MRDTLDGFYFENTPQESYSYGPSCSASDWIVFKDLGWCVTLQWW